MDSAVLLEMGEERRDSCWTGGLDAAAEGVTRSHSGCKTRIAAHMRVYVHQRGAGAFVKN